MIQLDGAMQPLRELRGRMSAALTEDDPRATLEAPRGELPPLGAFVRVTLPNGESGVYRVQSITEDPCAGLGKAQLRGALSLLEDRVFPVDAQPLRGQAKAVLRTLLSGTRWQVGVVELEEEVTLPCAGRSALACLRELLAQHPSFGPRAFYEGDRFTLGLVARREAVEAEGRLCRNVLAAKLMRTRENLATLALSPQLPGGALLGEAAEAHGAIARTLSLPEDIGEDEALAAARRFLQGRAEPALSLCLRLRDLSVATGEPLDGFCLGQNLRLCLPEGALVRRIMRITWADCARPEEAELELLAPEEIVRRYAREGPEFLLERIGEAARESRASAARLFRRIDRADQEIRLRASRTEVDALGEVVGRHSATLTIQADQIASKVSSVDLSGNRIASLINQTATTIKIQANRIDLAGYVTATLADAGYIRVDQFVSDQTTLNGYLRFSDANGTARNVSWQSRQVVTGVSASRTVENRWLFGSAGGGYEPAGAWRGRLVTGVEASTETIYYMGAD